MVDNPVFQNVASRMLSGYNAYDGSKRLCVQPLPTDTNGVEQPLETNCMKDLGTVISGACSLNFVTMW